MKQSGGEPVDSFYREDPKRECMNSLRCSEVMIYDLLSVLLVKENAHLESKIYFFVVFVPCCLLCF